MLRRKDAAWLVARGRAEWVSGDQVRLNRPNQHSKEAVLAGTPLSAKMPIRVSLRGDLPDLKEMTKREPVRYAAFWRGAGGKHAAGLANQARGACKGGGATVGRTASNRTVYFGNNQESEDQI